MEPLREGQYYRCKACGNKTRFDVTVTRTFRYFHHPDIEDGMRLRIEEEEILRETIEAISCRWCGHGQAIEVIEGSDTTPPA